MVLQLRLSTSGTSKCLFSLGSLSATHHRAQRRRASVCSFSLVLCSLPPTTDHNDGDRAFAQSLLFLWRPLTPGFNNRELANARSHCSTVPPTSHNEEIVALLVPFFPITQWRMSKSSFSFFLFNHRQQQQRSTSACPRCFVPLPLTTISVENGGRAQPLCFLVLPPTTRLIDGTRASKARFLRLFFPSPTHCSQLSNI